MASSFAQSRRLEIRAHRDEGGSIEFEVSARPRGALPPARRDHTVRASSAAGEVVGSIGGANPNLIRSRPMASRTGPWTRGRSSRSRQAIRPRTRAAHAFRRQTLRTVPSPNLVGINHVVLEVGNVEEALSLYNATFDFKLRGASQRDRPDDIAFIIDMGDQYHRHGRPVPCVERGPQAEPPRYAAFRSRRR